MKLKRSLVIVLSISAVLLCSVFALCLNGSSQEKTTVKDEVKKMTKEVGGTEPELIVGQYAERREWERR